jgi:hypothetical protein
VVDRGLGIFLTGLEGHGGRGGVGGGVEKRGAAPARCGGEVHQGGGGDEVGTDRYFQKKLRHTREKGAGGLGLKPNAVPLYPAPEATEPGQAEAPGQMGRGMPQACHAEPNRARPLCHGSVL